MLKNSNPGDMQALGPDESKEKAARQDDGRLFSTLIVQR